MFTLFIFFKRPAFDFSLKAFLLLMFLFSTHSNADPTLENYLNPLDSIFEKIKPALENGTAESKTEDLIPLFDQLPFYITLQLIDALNGEKESVNSSVELQKIYQREYTTLIRALEDVSFSAQEFYLKKGLYSSQDLALYKELLIFWKSQGVPEQFLLNGWNATKQVLESSLEVDLTLFATEWYFKRKSVGDYFSLNQLLTFHPLGFNQANLTFNKRVKYLEEATSWFKSHKDAPYDEIPFKDLLPEKDIYEFQRHAGKAISFLREQTYYLAQGIDVPIGGQVNVLRYELDFKKRLSPEELYKALDQLTKNDANRPSSSLLTETQEQLVLSIALIGEKAWKELRLEHKIDILINKLREIRYELGYWWKVDPKNRTTELTKDYEETLSLIKSIAGDRLNYDHLRTASAEWYEAGQNEFNEDTKDHKPQDPGYLIRQIYAVTHFFQTSLDLLIALPLEIGGAGLGIASGYGPSLGSEIAGKFIFANHSWFNENLADIGGSAYGTDKEFSNLGGKSLWSWRDLKTNISELWTPAFPVTHLFSPLYPVGEAISKGFESITYYHSLAQQYYAGFGDDKNAYENYFKDNFWFEANQYVLPTTALVVGTALSAGTSGGVRLLSRLGKLNKLKTAGQLSRYRKLQRLMLRDAANSPLIVASTLSLLSSVGLELIQAGEIEGSWETTRLLGNFWKSFGGSMIFMGGLAKFGQVATWGSGGTPFAALLAKNLIQNIDFSEGLYGFKETNQIETNGDLRLQLPGLALVTLSNIVDTFDVTLAKIPESIASHTEAGFTEEDYETLNKAISKIAELGQEELQEFMNLEATQLEAIAFAHHIGNKRKVGRDGINQPFVDPETGYSNYHSEDVKFKDLVLIAAGIKHEWRQRLLQGTLGNEKSDAEKDRYKKTSGLLKDVKDLTKIEVPPAFVPFIYASLLFPLFSYTGFGNAIVEFYSDFFSDYDFRQLPLIIKACFGLVMVGVPVGLLGAEAVSSIWNNIKYYLKRPFATLKHGVDGALYKIINYGIIKAYKADEKERVATLKDRYRELVNIFVEFGKDCTFVEAYNFISNFSFKKKNNAVDETLLASAIEGFALNDNPEVTIILYYLFHESTALGYYNLRGRAYDYLVRRPIDELEALEGDGDEIAELVVDAKSLLSKKVAQLRKFILDEFGIEDGKTMEDLFAKIKPSEIAGIDFYNLSPMIYFGSRIERLLKTEGLLRRNETLSLKQLLALWIFYKEGEEAFTIYRGRNIRRWNIEEPLFTRAQIKFLIDDNRLRSLVHLEKQREYNKIEVDNLRSTSLAADDLWFVNLSVEDRETILLVLRKICETYDRILSEKEKSSFGVLFTRARWVFKFHSDYRLSTEDLVMLLGLVKKYDISSITPSSLEILIDEINVFQPSEKRFPWSRAVLKRIRKALYNGVFARAVKSLEEYLINKKIEELLIQNGLAVPIARDINLVREHKKRFTYDVDGAIRALGAREYLSLQEAQYEVIENMHRAGTPLVYYGERHPIYSPADSIEDQKQLVELRGYEEANSQYLHYLEDERLMHDDSDQMQINAFNLITMHPGEGVLEFVKRRIQDVEYPHQVLFVAIDYFHGKIDLSIKVEIDFLEELFTSDRIPQNEYGEAYRLKLLAYVGSRINFLNHNIETDNPVGDLKESLIEEVDELNRLKDRHLRR